MIIAVIVLSGLEVVAGGRRRRRHEPDPEPGEVAPTVSEVEPGTDLVLLEDEGGSRVVIQSVDDLPQNL